MAARVALGVPEAVLIAEQLVKSAQQIRDDIGIGIFVQRDARRGMRRVHQADALSNAALGDQALNSRGDVYEVAVLGGGQAEGERGAFVASSACGGWRLLF
jgi:hypothetical protein